MDKTAVIPVLIYFALIGWLVHKVMGEGNHGKGILHYLFVGGCGSGLGALLEWITGRYSQTIGGVIVLCFICSCVIEYGIRRLKKKLLAQASHRVGALTPDDIGGNIDDWTIYE